MSNATIKVQGTVMTITVDLAKSIGPTGSGENIMVSSVNEKLSGELAGHKLGFNLYRKPKTEAELRACADAAKVAAALKAAKAA